MIVLFLLLSVLFTVLLLVLSFENIASRCTDLMFLFASVSSNTTVTFLIFGVATLGVMAGLSYAGLFWSIFKNRGNDEDEVEEEEY